MHYADFIQFMSIENLYQWSNDGKTIHATVAHCKIVSSCDHELGIPR